MFDNPRKWITGPGLGGLEKGERGGPKNRDSKFFGKKSGRGTIGIGFELGGRTEWGVTNQGLLPGPVVLPRRG